MQLAARPRPTCPVPQFQRFRVGFVSVEEIARRRARTLLVPSPSGWSQTVLDFGVNDLKKGTCSPIVVRAQSGRAHLALSTSTGPRMRCNQGQL